ncbi:hypothetical protein MASR1M12_01880 [Erysipelotrichia bacterium]
MGKTATIQSRVEPGIKTEVEKVLKTLGLTTSEAIRIFFRRIIMEQEEVAFSGERLPT